MGTSLTATGVQFPDNSVQVAPAMTGFRNRIINGNMKIDQRNAGALVTYQTSGYPTGAANGYFIDRFVIRNLRTNGGLLTAQQVADAPTGSGLNYCASIINQTGGVTAADDVIFFRQYVEGLQTSDLQWGTLYAKTCTLSFWVKSSVTGTFVVSFRNAAFTDTYVTTYTINSINTWEYKTITVPGATTGVWDTTTTTGMTITWDLGSGSTYNAPVANAWTTGNYITVAGVTKISNTTGANIRFTGIQFEKGSIATEFEFRPYQIELALCQRYYERRTVTGAVANERLTTTGLAASATTAQFPFQHLVIKRDIPSVNVVNLNKTNTYDGGGLSTPTSWSLDNAGLTITNITVSGITSATRGAIHWTWNNLTPLPYIEISSEL